jgi:hypothetical protein
MLTDAPTFRDILSKPLFQDGMYRSFDTSDSKIQGQGYGKNNIVHQDWIALVERNQ